MFLRGCNRVLARTFLTYTKTTTWYANFYLLFIRTLFIESDLTKVGEIDTRQPSYASSACQSVEPVSRKRTCKVGPGLFIPQCLWIKKEETSLLRTCVEHGGAIRSALGHR